MRMYICFCPYTTFSIFLCVYVNKASFDQTISVLKINEENGLNARCMFIYRFSDFWPVVIWASLIKGHRPELLYLIRAQITTRGYR